MTNKIFNSVFHSKKEQPFGQFFIILAFVAALFCSAFLIFIVQPMFTKLVLPKLGGAPAIWSVGVVVFQGLLLAGYFYAHLLTRYGSMRVSILIHLAVLFIAALTLPISLAQGFGNPPEEGQAFWVMGFYLVSIGAPFFALAGNGPLLQAWFSRSNNSYAEDPYFLYNASNLGSFIALLAYPVLIEPLIPISSQSLLWSIGYFVLIGAISLAGFTVWKQKSAASSSNMSLHAADGQQATSYRVRLLWILLSFIPSALMVAVTAHISTDIASAPFIWIIPLALFLLTFIFAFKSKPFFDLSSLEKRVPIYALPLAIIYIFYTFNLLLSFFLNIIFFFIAALTCHQRLYNLRPSTQNLTEFYLYMSLGGVLGGAFAALAAPYLFNNVFEYPLLIVSAVIVATLMNATHKFKAIKNIFVIIFTGSMIIYFLFYSNVYIYISQKWDYSVTSVIMFGLVLLVVCALAFSRMRYALAAFVPLIFFYSLFFKDYESDKTSERSFFGVHKIGLGEEGKLRVLLHGTTIHGAMQIKTLTGEPVLGRPVPLTYYNPNGAIAQSLHAVPDKPEGRSLAVIGLGTGAHSCNGQANDQWTYFEIDPLVVKIAKNPAYFRFLAECAPKAKIILGDARITLSDQPKGSFDYLLIDAFSSDAIPLHLLTKEAIALYLSVLKEDGVLVLHITNRHLELASVVAALAKDAGIAGRIRWDKTPEGVSYIVHSNSTVVTLTRSTAVLAKLDSLPGWQLLSTTDTPVWVDDFSNVLGALWRHYTKP